MTIRRATYEEAKALKEWDEFIGDRRDDNMRGELLVAAVDGAVAGYIHYSSNRFHNKPFIVLMCVRSGHRRRGIAQLLVQSVIELFKGSDVWTSTEDYCEGATQLFLKLGFQKAGEIEGLNRDGSKEIHFVRRGKIEQL